MYNEICFIIKLCPCVEFFTQVRCNRPTRFWPHPLSTFSQAAPTVSLATAGNLGDTGGDMLQSVGVARAWYESIAGAACACVYAYLRVCEIQPLPESSFWHILWWQHWLSSRLAHTHIHPYTHTRGEGERSGESCEIWNRASKFRYTLT